MSEAYLELRADFPAGSVRDMAIDFLNDEGPTHEEEVEESYRDLFPLQDDVESPQEVKAIGSRTLYALFAVFGHGVLLAQEYMEIFHKVGAKKIYGLFTDDEGSEEGWTIKNGKLLTFYTGFEGDEETAELLLELDDNDRLPKLIELYESGALKAKEG
jgi:hypothetical protein